MRGFLLVAALSLGLIAPGLSAPQQAQLVQAGAFGRHPVRVLLLGDSIALTLGIGLAHGARSQYGLTLSNHSSLGCDLDPDLEVNLSGKPGPATGGCNHWQGLWPFLTAAQAPDVVLLGVGRWEVSDHFYEGHWVHIGDPTWDAHVAADLRQAIAIFHLFGAKVVLLTMPYVDPPNRQPDGQPWPENTPAYAQRYNALTRQVAGQVDHTERDEVTVVDLNAMLSPNGRFETTVHGVAARWSDGVHVTVAGGEYLQQLILPELDRIGLPAEQTVAAASAAAARSLHAKILAAVAKAVTSAAERAAALLAGSH
jgi:hypothetical protein